MRDSAHGDAGLSRGRYRHCWYPSLVSWCDLTLGERLCVQVEAMGDLSGRWDSCVEAAAQLRSTSKVVDPAMASRVAAMADVAFVTVSYKGLFHAHFGKRDLLMRLLGTFLLMRYKQWEPLVSLMKRECRGLSQLTAEDVVEHLLFVSRASSLVICIEDVMACPVELRDDLIEQIRALLACNRATRSVVVMAGCHSLQSMQQLWNGNGNGSLRGLVEVGLCV